MQKKAAELLKIKPTTLNEMIKRYEIGPPAQEGRRSRRTNEPRRARARQSFSGDGADTGVVECYCDHRLAARADRGARLIGSDG